MFSLKDRAGRTEFIVHSLSDYVIAAVFGIAFANSQKADPSETSRYLDQVNAALFAIVSFAAAIAGFCVTIRRFHDLGKSGSHFFGFLLPLYNLYLILILYLQEGHRKTNRYGPPIK